MLEMGLPLVWDEPQTTWGPSHNGQTQDVLVADSFDSCIYESKQDL